MSSSSKVIQVLNIITFSRIDDYVNFEALPEKKVFKKVSGEDFSEAFSEVTGAGEAKILPLKKDDLKSLESSSANLNEEVHMTHSKHQSMSENKGHDLESIGILSSSKLKEIALEETRRKKASEKSETNFILNEREKLKKTKVLMFEKEAIRNYEASKKLEMGNKAHSDREKKSNSRSLNINNRGVLINKKLE